MAKFKANTAPKAASVSNLLANRKGAVGSQIKRQGKAAGALKDNNAKGLTNAKGKTRSIAQATQDAASSKNSAVRASVANALDARMGRNAGVTSDGTFRTKVPKTNSSGVVGGANAADGANSRAWKNGNNIMFRNADGSKKSMTHEQAMNRMKAGGTITRNQANAAHRIMAGKSTG